ncbi:glycine betaine ABC transporter substrate-binding protein [Actinotalea sp. M2MS4P-6]|uniref:glycine betaine ABC transporter substrate-binding protein n=1 Tax=Actinotalea sp. M2MS4P-6 TaxID=2983762 RepID=UPI0021E38DBB|nr:glycine betaine ABC transporter substrate-binding protein [Actinotalea sp. M2MS4P-6]MCV2393103.1 glycine betaine ABC transporter substrate-binding protein [Actinotalea sp. M2MS4P-6]
MNRTLTAGALLAGTALLLTACSSGGSSGGGEGPLAGAKLSVGGKDFTEQLILCEISDAVLADAGADVTNRCNIQGTEATRQALLSGEIDTYWEYTGTGWITHLGNTDPIQDSQEQWQAVKDQDLAENNIVWLDYAPFNNTYALAANKDTIAQYGNISTLSDLAEVNNNGDMPGLCVESEFSVRNDGLPGMEEKYGTTFSSDQISELATGAIYQATGEGDCEFGEVFTTDGRIVQYDLTVLEDDQSFFPIYNPAPNVRKEAMDEYPAIADVFAPISAALDNDTMTQLNASVDVDGNDPADVARDWLTSEGLIG